MSIIRETFQLNDGQQIPKLGFGTWQIPNGEVAYESTLAALRHGYRHIDSARGYDNEESIGQAIRDSGIPRDEIYLTTKLPADIKTYEGALESFAYSMAQFGEGIDYVDLYLIHAPWSWDKKGTSDHAGNLEAWRAMTKLQADGQIRSIGVSNFSIDDLENILEHSPVVPAVNQIRWFVGHTEPELSQFCADQGILIEAYSPLAAGKLLDNAKLLELAEKTKRTLPQICLRYALQKGVLPLPKSTHEAYIEANSQLDFTLEDEDMAFLDSLDFSDI